MERLCGWLRQPDLQGHAVTLLAIAAGFVSVVVADPALLAPPRGLLLLAAGLAYALVGTVGLERAAAASRPAHLLYFAIQLALGAVIAWLSELRAWVALLPLLSQAMMLAPTGGWLVVAGVLLVIWLLPTALEGADPARLLAAAVNYLAAAAFVVIFTHLALREARARAEVERLVGELRQTNEHLRAAARQAEELAAAQERNRLAREIHDSLGHYLTVINVQLSAARAVLEHDRRRALEALATAQGLAQEGLAEVRRSVAALRAGPGADQPLTGSIADLAVASRAAGLPTELIVVGAPRPLSPQAELALYRAAQEGLTNVRKHARASRVDLMLDYRDAERVRLVIRDDGIGAATPDDGFGLLGARERAQLLGGQLTVKTAPRQGFSLTIEVPG